jgi:hypothetical protein
MRTLTEIINANESDKGTTIRWAHNYTSAYERWFEPIRDEPIRLLEIGVCDPAAPGASLNAWYEYFPKATIYGFDIVDAHRFDNDRITTFVGDQSSPKDLAQLAESSGGDFDVIIDDGSHHAAHQQISLAALFGHLKPGGLYFIEDLQVGANTVRLLERMRLPGDRATISLRHRAATALRSALYSKSVRFAPYITPQQIEEIRRNTARLDLVCDAKLARLSRH